MPRMAALPAASDPATARRLGAEARYEVMPFARAEAQAAEIGETLRLTVTTSPKHGVDRSLAVATRLRAQQPRRIDNLDQRSAQPTADHVHEVKNQLVGSIEPHRSGRPPRDRALP